jgi:hypothetical protein
MAKSVLVRVALLCLVVPAVAHAQSASRPAGGRIFISVNGLGQAGDGDVITQSQSSVVYDEPATATATQQPAFPNGLFDIGGGFRTDQFGIGVAYTAAGTGTGTAVAVTAIPHPFLFNRPRTVVTDIDDMEHKEKVFHIQAYYFMPVAEKFELGLFVGPSFYSVKQDYVTGLGTFSETSNPDVITVALGKATASDSHVGYNIGAEGTYSFTPNVGAAVLLRFTRASVDLDLGGQPTTMNVGDIQFGAGLRFRF